MKVELQYDYSLHQAVNAIPRLVEAQRFANAFAIAKELYTIGEMSKEDYSETLLNLLKGSGFKTT